MKLILKLKLIPNNIELARVTGVQLSQVWVKGQTFRVESSLIRHTKHNGYFIRTYPRKKIQFDDNGKKKEKNITTVPEYEELYRDLHARTGTLIKEGISKVEGAVVIEPSTGYYCDAPIATLDFASLYPSIMMRYNLSFDTLLYSKEYAAQQNIKEEDMLTSPLGYHFVKREKKQGILPMILNDLLSARKVAKKAMKNATTEFEKGIMDGRQLALKVCANSVYGYTGASICAVPCVAVTSSVTAFGRKMIYATKDFVEKNYDAEVVYGDTDSVMIKFPDGTTVKEAIDKAKGIEKDINPALFLPPVFLEYEKVFFPFLLLQKKKYVALKFEEDPDHGKIDAKGIEMVRRDNCRLVSETQSKCIHILLHDRDLVKAIDCLQGALRDLVNNRVDLDLLVVSKALKKQPLPEEAKKCSKKEIKKRYPASKYYHGQLPHVNLATKMRIRNPADAPVLGQRIPYIVLVGRESNIANRGEEPKMVKQQKLKVDVHYYVKQMRNSFKRIFDEVIGSEETNALFIGDHMVPENNIFKQFVVKKRKRKHPEIVAPDQPKRRREAPQPRFKPISF